MFSQPCILCLYLNTAAYDCNNCHVVNTQSPWYVEYTILSIIVINRFFGFSDKVGKLVQRWHYTVVRHPIMTGFFVLFFGVPTMTANHFFFSVSCTLYIVLAVVFLEEPDLRNQHGKAYEKYAEEVPMFCPLEKLFSRKKAKQN